MQAAEAAPAATSPAAETAAGAIPAVVKAPNDESQFRRLVLPNGLKVLLLSDPKLNKSSAALAVHVGQIDDPVDRPGMAHFLEHMLFLGTEKFPDVAEYSGFIKANGGYNNAYTSSDLTNYLFEVRHEAFDGALDRFAQFFIAPLFTPEFTAREVTAINNEASRYLENDGRRLFVVRRELYAPESGEHKFSTGNKETLAGVTREDLLAFYRAHYTADRMALSLCGKASLDELEAWAKKYFSAVPKHDLPPIVREAKFLPSRAALRLAKIEPVKDVRQLSLEFPVGATRPAWAAKPDALLEALLGHEGPGSLLAQLKAEGLALNLEAGIWERTAAYGSFLVNIGLTPRGLEQTDRVLQVVFAYLDLLKRSPYPREFFAERAALARLEETYRDRGEGADLARELARRALVYPLEIAERESFLWLRPDEAAYRAVLERLRPDNLLAVVIAKGVPTDRSEKYFAVKYSYAEDAGPAYQALLAPPAVAGLALPKPNPFIPTATALLPEQPVRVLDEPGLRLFYQQDTRFERPMSAFVFRVRAPRELATPEASALLKFYAACVNEAASEVANDARLAGINYQVTAGFEGVRVAVDGYSGSADRFFEYLGGQLVDFALTEERFAAVKDAIVRGLASFGRSETYEIARARKWAFAREFFWLPSEEEAYARTVTLADVRAFARRLLARGRIEGVAHGNLDAATAIARARDFQRRLGLQPAAAADLLTPRFNRPAAGERIVDASRVEGVNSCLWREFVFPAETPELRAAGLVLNNFVSEPFYTEMRTKQQLGYVVWAGANVVDLQSFAFFVIQSADYPPDELQARADAYLATLPAQWSALTDDQFATFVAGARANLKEKEKTIGERALTLHELAYKYGGDWGRKQAVLAALDGLTKQRVGEILAAVFGDATKRQRTVLLTGKKHEPKAPIEPTFTDRAAWKKTRTFE